MATRPGFFEPRISTPTLPMNVGEYAYTVIIELRDTKRYLVTCPALPGVVAEGDTLDEALALAQDSIECYISTLLKDGIAPPSDKTVLAVPVRARVVGLGN